MGILPFDHNRQMCSVLVAQEDKPPLLITKGAPEAILARCPVLPAGAQSTLDGLFAEGDRVVAVATRELPGATAPTTADEAQLTLVGYLTFADRPKADAGSAITKLSGLGVDVKIITGDNGIVAGKVCRDIGLKVDGILSGEEITKLGDDALTAAISKTTVFARVSPNQKSRIIKNARGRGQDVAFLGDGVNDAVALHNADVGISVDSGTDVAKDAASVVMLDKDLGVLAEGVVEGRRIFNNTMKYVLMATSSNFGNMFSAAGSSLFLSFLPMLPSQILLNNLLYDAGQMAIPTDNVDPEQLARPAAWDIKFVRHFMYVFGPVSSLFDFLTFWVMLSVLHAGHSEFRTGWFVESIATQTLVVYVIRTRRFPFFRSRASLPMILVPIGTALVGMVLPFTPLAHPLGFTSLPVEFFVVLAGMIVSYLVLTDVTKVLFYRALGQEPSQPTSAEPQLPDKQIQRRAAPFTRHSLTTLGHWFHRRDGSTQRGQKTGAGDKQTDGGGSNGADDRGRP